MHGRLTVGYDGSPAAARAVRWAADEAAQRGAVLRLVACYSPPAMVSPWIGTIPYDIDEMRLAADQALRDIADQIGGDHPDLKLEGGAVLGSARQQLVEEAADSDLLVVGTTGAGEAESWLLGSVAHAVARTSPKPVALVPTAEPEQRFARVAVGVDGSPSADAALDWAVEFADAHDAELVVAHAWEYSKPAGRSSAEGHDFARVDAALVLDDAVERAREQARGQVRAQLVEGGPAAALVELAAEADVVVVGSRGRGGLRSMLFGSVAHAVAQNAPCPTVVVRA